MCNEKSHFSHYWFELRRCLLKSLLVWGFLLITLLPFSNKLYHLLALPLIQSMSPHSMLIATALTAPFIAPMKVAFLISIFMSIPFFLFQIWSFVMPALYINEKRWAGSLIFTSIFLFYTGVFFAYFIIFPILFRFLLQMVPEGVVMMPDINLYLDLASQLLIAFGFAFQVPVVIVFLARSGLIPLQHFIENRSYFIIGAFIAAMLIGPPDVGSQLLLAIPVCLLFEAGIFVARIFPYETSPSSSK